MCDLPPRVGQAFMPDNKSVLIISVIVTRTPLGAGGVWPTNLTQVWHRHTRMCDLPPRVVQAFMPDNKSVPVFFGYRHTHPVGCRRMGDLQISRRSGIVTQECVTYNPSVGQAFTCTL